MRDLSEIRQLLDELDHQPANALEDQDLDFKEWNTRSISDGVTLVIEMAICMANGGGGTVVFGVNDKASKKSGLRFHRFQVDPCIPRTRSSGRDWAAHYYADLSGTAALHGYKGTRKNQGRQRLSATHWDIETPCNGGDWGDRFYSNRNPWQT